MGCGRVALRRPAAARNLPAVAWKLATDLGVAGRRLHLKGIEGGIQKAVGIGDQGELPVLILGHEAGKRERLGHAGKLGQPRRQRIGLGQRRRR